MSFWTCFRSSNLSVQIEILRVNLLNILLFSTVYPSEWRKSNRGFGGIAPDDSSHLVIRVFLFRFYFFFFHRNKKEKVNNGNIKPSPLLPLPLEREITNRKCNPEQSEEWRICEFSFSLEI